MAERLLKVESRWAWASDLTRKEPQSGAHHLETGEMVSSVTHSPCHPVGQGTWVWKSQTPDDIIILYLCADYRLLAFNTLANNKAP